MIISIHQPHLFPWIPYFKKIDRSDVFVLLTEVQFRKGYYQNRSKVKGKNFHVGWLTIPVEKMPLQTKICDMKVSQKYNPMAVLANLEARYCKAPAFAEVFGEVSSILTHEHNALSDFSIDSTLWALEKLGIKTEVLLDTSVASVPKSLDASERLAYFCKLLGANTYVMGAGGKNYIDVTQFDTVDITLESYAFDPSLIPYYQDEETFTPGLSILDMFFNVGFEKARHLFANHNVL